MNRYTTFLLSVLMLLFAACSPRVGDPEDAFLDSTLILRPGIADAGSMTVRQYVKRLASLPQPNGTPAKINGWTQTDQGYTLHAKVAGEFQVPFVWSKSEKLALLQYAEMDGERVPGMQFYMLTMSMKPVGGDAASDMPQKAQPADSAVQQEKSLVPWGDYMGNPASLVLTHASVGGAFKMLLGNKFTVLETNLQESGELGAVDDHLIIGSGHAINGEGREEAIIGINKTTNTHYAVLLTDGIKLNAFGVNNMKDLPAPLKQWVIEKGGKL